MDGTHDRVCSYPIKNYLMGVGERLIPHNKKLEDKHYDKQRVQHYYEVF